VEVKVQLTRDDLLRLAMYNLRRSPTHRTQVRAQAFILIIIVGAAGIGLSYLLEYIDLLTEVTQPLFMLLAILIACLGVPIMQRRYAVPRQMARFIAEHENREVLSERTISISSEGVSIDSEFGHAVTYWKGVEAIERDTDAAYIIFGTRGTLMLPKRFFAYAAEMNAFFDMAKEFRSQVKWASWQHLDAPRGDA
jgi:YcxB-like protein